MKRVYTAWGKSGQGEATTLVSGEGPPEFADKDAVLLWRLETQSWEEAKAITNLRNGWSPYIPLGNPAPCPKCGALYYPKGSGQCWRCDHEG
jgi:hypothetical protein